MLFPGHNSSNSAQRRGKWKHTQEHDIAWNIILNIVENKLSPGFGQYFN